MPKLIERLRTISRTGEKASSSLPTIMPRRFQMSRGIIDQIAYPLIDESDDLQVMRLAKFKHELERGIVGYKHFSICEVREFMEEFNIPLTADTAKSFALLRSMHCVKFDMVPARLYEKIPHLINHCISCGQITHPLIQHGAVIDV